MAQGFSTTKCRRRLFVVVAGAVAGAVLAVAVGWLNRSSASLSPAAGPTMNVRPVRDSSPPVRFVPPSKGPCRSADLSLRVVPTEPPDPNTVASVAVTSTRACRLGGRQSVTPQRVDGRAAAAPVDFGDAGDYHAVTVSPGHAASLWVVFADPGCRFDKHSPAGLAATAFSFDLGGARGVFRLGHPVTACPMYAGTQSSDIYTKGDVELAGPANVRAGGRYDAHVDFHYLDTAAAVLDPCPTAWARVTPQSGAEITTYWQLVCHGMRPITFGDHLGIDLPLTIPAGLPSQSADIHVGFGLPSPLGPAPANRAAALLLATQRIWVTGDHPLQPVPFLDVPPPATPELRRTTSPPCDATDLAPGNLHLPFNGATGHVSMWFTLVNVAPHPCTLLRDTPIRLSAPGQAELTVPVGDTSVPASVDGELAAGGTTTVQMDVGTSCDQGAPVVNYTSVNIELPRGTLVAPFPIAVRCGVETPGIGVAGEISPMNNLVDLVGIHAPAELTRGRPTAIQVTLNSHNGADLNNVGYAVTIAGAETRHGFATDAIQRLLPDLPTIFDIQVDPPASLPPGLTSLRVEVLTGTVPADEIPIALT